MEQEIKHGDKITITNNITGTAVMKSPAGGWIINIGGRHGVPMLASKKNIMCVKRSNKTVYIKKN